MRYPSAATASQCYEFDIIICATGFDAITGAFDRIDIRGVDGVRLKEVWKDGPQTYLGVFIERFPNLLMAMGPHAGLGNYTRTAEYSVEWVTGIIQFATERGLTRVEATAAGVAEWTDHVLALGQLMNEIGSWMLAISGVAAAIPHDPGLLLALDIAVDARHDFNLKRMSSIEDIAAQMRRTQRANSSNIYSSQSLRTWFELRAAGFERRRDADEVSSRTGSKNGAEVSSSAAVHSVAEPDSSTFEHLAATLATI